MKWLLTLLACIAWSTCSTQVIFVTENRFEADYKIYITENRFEADWIIYPSQNQYQARNYSGVWYVGNTYESDTKFYKKLVLLSEAMEAVKETA